MEKFHSLTSKKKKRVVLSFKVKQQVLKDIKDPNGPYVGLTREQIAANLGIANRTLQKMIELESQINSVVIEKGREEQKNQSYPRKFKEIEDATLQWILECLQRHCAIVDWEIQRKAIQMAQSMNIKGFVGGNIWLKNFKRENRLTKEVLDCSSEIPKLLIDNDDKRYDTTQGSIF